MANPCNRELDRKALCLVGEQQHGSSRGMNPVNDSGRRERITSSDDPHRRPLSSPVIVNRRVDGKE